MLEYGAKTRRGGLKYFRGKCGGFFEARHSGTHIVGLGFAFSRYYALCLLSGISLLPSFGCDGAKGRMDESEVP